MHVQACRLVLTALNWRHLATPGHFSSSITDVVDSEGKTLITSKKLNKDQPQVNHLSA